MTFKYLETWPWSIRKCSATDSWVLVHHNNDLCFKSGRILMMFLSYLLLYMQHESLHNYQQLCQPPLTEHFSFQLKQGQLVPFLQPWWTVKVKFHYSRDCCYGHTSSGQRVLSYSWKTYHSRSIWHISFLFLQFLKSQWIKLRALRVCCFYFLLLLFLFITILATKIN